MKNFGLQNLKVSNVDTFTTPLGLKIRKNINGFLKPILKVATGKKINVHSYPELEKDKAYVFASTHYFNEDIITALATIDRNAYALIGTTNQIDNNPLMYAAWINGMVYVDRLNDKSRKESVDKMKKVLSNGNSVLIFPEGGWNNTENLLVQSLFAGPYILSKDMNVEVVPISTYYDEDGNEIHVKFGEPLKLYNYDKKDALRLLRDSMATMMYELIEEYSKPLVRCEIVGDHHLDYMEARRKEYLKTKWTEDVWDEELTVYQEKGITTPKQIRESLDKVEVNADNAYVMAPVLVKRLEDKKYDFKDYMKRNWNK